MIPRFDEDVDPQLPAHASFWVPDPANLVAGEPVAFFHDTELIVTDMDEARRVMEAERIAVQFAERHSTSVNEFEEILDQAEFEMPDVPSDEAPAFLLEDGLWHGVNGLEIGVAGLVHALNAVGVVTAASCRAHSEEHRRWASRPAVVCAIGRDHAETLAALVAAAGCGFELNEEDYPHLLAVVAPSIVEMMELAARVESAERSFG